MFQIDLTANGDLQLILPDARTLEIPATTGGLIHIKKIISDHRRGLRDQRGYIGTLPTQHAVDRVFADQFLADKRQKAADAAKQETKVKAEKLNINWDGLEINL
jgi:hypothetical protein